MRDSLGLVLSVVLSAALLGAPADARAWCRMTTAATGSFAPDECDTVNTPLIWTRPCIQYSVQRDGARDFDDATALRIIESSFQTWMDVRCDGQPLDFMLRRRDERVACDKAEYNSGAGNVNVVTFVDDWASRSMHDPRAFALTTVWHNRSTGEVYDADIEINQAIGTYAECAPSTGCDDGRIDLANVLTHEVGHFFTMAHSDNPVSTMWWMANPGDVDKRILRTDDITGICSIYPPGSLTAACDYEERGGFSGECGGGGGGGCCAVGDSARARPSDGQPSCSCLSASSPAAGADERDARCAMRGARCAERDAGSGERDARCGERGAGCAMRGARCAERDARCGERGAGSAMRGARSAMRGARCAERGAGSAMRGARCGERGARSAMRGARCGVRDARCAVRDARSAMRGARCAERGAGGGSAMRGARCAERDARSAMRDARCGERDARCAMRGAGSAVRGAGSAMRGARCAMRGARCAMRGARCAVRDARSGERGAGSAMSGARCAERGARCGERGARCAERDARCAERDARCGERDARCAMRGAGSAVRGAR